MVFDVSMVKYALYILNELISSLGIVLATFGGCIYSVKLNDYSEFIPEEVSAFTIILIILGAFMFVNSLIGCYGAITENATQLLIFSVFLFICIFFEMGTIIAAGENKQRLNQYVPMKLSDTLAGSNTTESYRSAWDFLQSEHECCGINGPEDWINQTAALPASCCKKRDEDFNCTTQDAFIGGCKYPLLDLLHKQFLIFILMGVAAGLLQFACSLLACCLYSEYQRR